MINPRDIEQVSHDESNLVMPYIDDNHLKERPRQVGARSQSGSYEALEVPQQVFWITFAQLHPH